MKSYKIIGEIVLAIFLLLVGYFLYQLGMNMKHDLPIIKGIVGEDNAGVKDKCKGTNGKTSDADCMLIGLDKSIYTVATFTEDIGLLETDISYPAGRSDILDIIKGDYEKFKSENSDMLQASTSPNQNPVMYTVNYDELATTTYDSNYLGYKLTYYKYAGGAHGSPGVWSYNYIGDRKVDGLYDMYKIVKNNENNNPSNKIKSKEDFYKTLYNESKKQIMDEWANDTDIDKKWIEEGLLYSATNTSNYDTWWIRGDSLYIYIAPYQIGPYSEGDKEVKILLGILR